MSAPVIVIVLHWKNASDTLVCLRSLKKCSYDNFSVLLVLNGASFEDKITLTNWGKDWPALKIIKNETNLGFAEGNNIAIRQALKENQPDYILTLNNDTEVTTDFITQAVAQAQAGYDLVQCLMYDFTQRDQIDKAGLKLTLSGLTFDIKNLADPAPLFCPSAGAALYSVRMLSDVALDRQVSTGFHSTIIKDYFDKDYFAYAEDFDLGFRARLKGWRATLAPTAIVYHQGSASTRTMSDLAIYHTYRNLIFTYIKCYPKKWLIWYFVFIKIGWLAILVKNLLRGQGKLIIAAGFDAWKYRQRMLKKRKLIQAETRISTKELTKYLSKKLFS